MQKSLKLIEINIYINFTKQSIAFQHLFELVSSQINSRDRIVNDTYKYRLETLPWEVSKSQLSKFIFYWV